MDIKRRLQKLKNIPEAIKRAPGISISMRNRLYAFLFVVIVAMLLGVVIILLATGQLFSGHEDAVRFVDNEFSRNHRDKTRQIGDTAVALVSLSQSLSRSIEYQLQSRNIPVSDLAQHPEILEELIAYELVRLQQAMANVGSSGVFMVLDATVNPDLENSEFSRAGLYLRDYEPRAVGTYDITWCFFRGFPSIAYQNNLTLQSAWDMEFDVRGRDFYQIPISKSRETTMPLSRLYFWSNESIIPGIDEAVLICSIPLLDHDGNAFGVCGFEISSWNFRFRFSSDAVEYPDAMSMFGRITDGGKLIRENALISGKQRLPVDSTPLSVISFNGLGRYRSESGVEYFGMHEEVRMYPADSPMAHERFALSLLIPAETIEAAAQRTNRTLLIVLLSFLVLGICVSIFIGNRFLKPITSAISAMHSGQLDSAEQTNIREIDELIKKIRETRSKDSPIPEDLFEEFFKRVKTLTPAEMAIFRHYYNGVGINELPAKMHISMNTLKSHNKHIYTKLNISSRDELMLYVELIRKSGLEERII